VKSLEELEPPPRIEILRPNSAAKNSLASPARTHRFSSISLQPNSPMPNNLKQLKFLSRLKLPPEVDKRKPVIVVKKTK
jgi:hypothetical protein